KTDNTASGVLNLQLRTILGDFYRVEAFLGEGCCGFVTRCRNTETNQAVAIKVNKDTPPIREQAQKEILMLKQLQDLDPDSCNIVKWNGLFLDRQHICLNFELLDQSLLDYIRDRYIQGLPISQLRPILYQLINALSHLSSKEIVHTDLKTDNLMVVDRSQFPVKVKIIDFGLARNISSLKPDDRVQNRWHRAPEAMIGAPLNQAIDMWSLGLIAVELATGLPLYPDSVLDCGSYTKCYFDLLVSLIKQMLHLDSTQRITPLGAPEHPFFNSENTEDQSLSFEPLPECAQGIWCQYTFGGHCNKQKCILPYNLLADLLSCYSHNLFSSNCWISLLDSLIATCSYI
uniref:Protein kinase domain-containing protein n=1 Tax=Amphilophus citrinellus TaxID=61819 RepID=A0A3Q0S0U5_AMPCI